MICFLTMLLSSVWSYYKSIALSNFLFLIIPDIFYPMFSIMKKKKRHSNFTCVLYLSTSFFVVIFFAHMTRNSIMTVANQSLLVEKTRQKEIRKGNDWVNSKIYTMWEQFFFLVFRHTNHLWLQTNPKSGYPEHTFKWVVGDIPGIRAILFPTRWQSSDIPWRSREGTRGHGQGGWERQDSSQG